MLNRSNPERIVLALALLLLFVAGLLASCTRRPGTPGAQDCAKVTDRRLAKDFKRRVKADRQFNNQRRHINVSVKDRIVTLEGWVIGKDTITVLERYASDTGCVTKVVNRLTSGGFSGGCGPGQKRCGDICIDQTSTCSLIE
ncbi:MAG TPA: BON domain-containing protein [Blastocatellia bacterium]|nr:BON domain-containing protein [Blastocatellia bacterium]